MIQSQSVLKVIDNSGVKMVKCIQILNGFKRRFGYVGDKIIVSVKELSLGGKVKKGQIYKALIVGTKKEIYRKDGSQIKFDENLVVLIDNQDNPIGTRIFYPICKEVWNKGYVKVASLAPYMV